MTPLVLHLENGVQFLFWKDNSFPLVSLHVFFKGGSLYEQKAQAGASFLLSKLIVRGPAGMDFISFVSKMEELGASISSDVAEDYVIFSLLAPSETFDEACRLFIDSILNPKWTEEDLRKARETALGELKSDQDDIFSFGYRTLREIMYSSGYNTYEKGYVKNINSFSLEFLKEWHGKFFKAPAVVSAMGKLKKSDVLKVAKLFSRIPKGKEVNSLEVDFSKPVKVSKKFPGPQALLMVGIPGPSVFDKEYPVFKVISAYLGGGMSSYLFVELREKRGYAYELASFMPTRIGKSRLVIYMGTSPDKLKQAKRDLLNLLKTLSFTPEGIEKAKRYLEGTFFIDHQTYSRVSWYRGWYQYLGVGWEFDKEYPELLKKVSLDDVSSLWEKIKGNIWVLEVK